jgi:hypothetical protein
MNERLNRERLLRDVLAEEPDADFRAALLDQSLRLAGRRRRGRRARRATAAAGVVFGLAVLVWRFGQPPSRGPEPRGYATVRTQPMVAGAVVATYPLAADRVLTSFPGAEMVQTPPRGRFREIDDWELIELAAPSPAVLVRSGAHQAELVFANPSGEARAPN